MSNFLAVDTSSRYLTVAAKNGERYKVNHIPDCSLNHSVVLMDEIIKTMDEVELTPGDCDYFVAVTGPGSFTGIRIGISCVKGFASALGKRAVGVTAFDMLSYNINSDCPFLVAIDAAHNHYYVCGYTADGVQDIPPGYLSFEEVEGFARPVYGFEELNLSSYKKLNVSLCLFPAAEGCEGAEGGVHALYVRKSQAEEERAARLGKA